MQDKSQYRRLTCNHLFIDSSSFLATHIFILTIEA